MLTGSFSIHVRFFSRLDVIRCFRWTSMTSKTPKSNQDRIFTKWRCSVSLLNHFGLEEGYIYFFFSLLFAVDQWKREEGGRGGGDERSNLVRKASGCRVVLSASFGQTPFSPGKKKRIMPRPVCRVSCATVLPPYRRCITGGRSFSSPRHGLWTRSRGGVNIT